MTTSISRRALIGARCFILALFTLMPHAAEAKAYLGKITAVNGISVTIAIRKAGVLTFAVPPPARVTLDNKNAPLTALAVGEVCTVNSDDGVTATTVHAHSHQGIDGKITGLTVNSVTVKPVGGVAKTYRLTAETATTIDAAASTVGDLRIGQSASVKSTDGVTASEIAVKTHQDYVGTISVVNSALVSIMFTPGEGRTFALAPSTTVTLNGAPSNVAALALGQFATISTADGAAAISIAVSPRGTRKK